MMFRKKERRQNRGTNEFVIVAQWCQYAQLTMDSSTALATPLCNLGQSTYLGTVSLITGSKMDC